MHYECAQGGVSVKQLRYCKPTSSLALMWPVLHSSRYSHTLNSSLWCQGCWKVNSIDIIQICLKEDILIYSSLILLHFPLGFAAASLHVFLLLWRPYPCIGTQRMNLMFRITWILKLSKYLVPWATKNSS